MNTKKRIKQHLAFLFMVTQQETISMALNGIATLLGQDQKYISDTLLSMGYKSNQAKRFTYPTIGERTTTENTVSYKIIEVKSHCRYYQFSKKDFIII